MSTSTSSSSPARAARRGPGYRRGYRFQRGYGGLVAGAATAVVLLAGWKLLEPHLPETLMRVAETEDRSFWPEGEGGPYHWKTERADAELLVVGDSRVQFGVEAGPLDAAGLGPTSILWGGGAQLLELLDIVRPMEPRRLVVVVSPFGFFRERSATAEELLALEPPAAEGEDGLQVLREWAERVREILVRRGATPEEADVFVGLWFERQRRDQERGELTTKAIDRALGEAFRLWRESWIRTVTSSPWRDSWFEVPRPEELAEEYRYGLRPETRPRRARGLERVVAELVEMRESGWEIVVVRTPVSEAIRAIEEEALPTSAVRAAFEEAGLPFLDHFRDEAVTLDGSHLGWTSAQAFSRRLAEELGGVFGGRVFGGRG